MFGNADHKDTQAEGSGGFQAKVKGSTKDASAADLRGCGKC